MQALDSVWLPDAFTPVAVSGVRHVSYDPVSGSLITSHPTSDGLTYTVTSYQFLSDLDPASWRRRRPCHHQCAQTLRALPKSVPEAVKALAERITAGQSTEYGKALALQNFFLGPAVTYNLNPPDDGYGISALTNFLFDTKQGYCQQFAGAYAVLARAIGLPTRLAVGFTTGTDSDNTGTYQVTDGDAHTWPEVYFGPEYGWLPFEPTKSFVDPPSAAVCPDLPTTVPAAAPRRRLQGSPRSRRGSSFRPASPAPAPASAVRWPVIRTLGQTTGHRHSTAWSVFLILLLVLRGWASVVTVVRRGGWRCGGGGRRRRSRPPWCAPTGPTSPTCSGGGAASRRPAKRTGSSPTGPAGFWSAGSASPRPGYPAESAAWARLATEATFAPSVPAGRAQRGQVRGPRDPSGAVPLRHRSAS